MILSMTGFGRAEWKDECWHITAEVRSVNQRGLKVSFRTPDALRSCEMELEGVIKQKVVRGHLFCVIRCDPSEAAADMIVDRERLRLYLSVIDSLKENLGTASEIDPTALLNLPGVVKREPLDEQAVEPILPRIEETLGRALDDLLDFRRREGGHLAEEFVRILEAIAVRVDAVAGRAPVVVEEYRQKLAARIQKILAGQGLELKADDLCREVAFFADRSDITEEIARLRSHIVKFRDALGAGDAVGRKLEFMTQEMLREANTMCSKSNDSELVHTAVEIKSEIDRLREQVLNVE